MRIYLDNASTTMVCREAAEAAVEAMTVGFGNPGSIHLMGREAKKLTDAARIEVAKALDCDAGEVFFTSCGTESDNWAIIKGAQHNSRVGRHVISSLAEHDAVLRSLDLLENDGFEVTRLRPQKDGSIAAADVCAALRPDTCLITLMAVNNETGAFTDMEEISAALKSADSNALLHTDAVQAFMKIPFSAKRSGADLVSISGHKIHAPKGIGALYIRNGLNLPPLLVGGRQESGRRSGTEATSQIAAFGAASKAAAECFETSTARMRALRNVAASRMEEMGITIIGNGAPHILSISLPGYKSEVVMNFLESKSVFVAKSSACKKGGRSHVLEAIGLKPSVIDGAIRVSLSRYTTQEEIDAFCAAIRDAKRLRH